MGNALFYRNLLDSLKDPFVFVDLTHEIRYMNKAAKNLYAQGELLIGKTIFECHNEKSNRKILEIFGKMKNGLEEELITDNKKYRIYMRAVYDQYDELIGYYERYEPPVQK